MRRGMRWRRKQAPGDDRVYGFYDPNAGIVEFSSAEKFGAYPNALLRQVRSEHGSKLQAG